MFHIHIKIFGFQKAGGLIEDPEQFFGGEPVLEVIGDPSLEAAERVGTEGAAAVDVFFVDASHFGDVSVSRDLSSVWKNETEIPVGVRGQQRFKFVKFHAFQRGQDSIWSINDDGTRSGKDQGGCAKDFGEKTLFHFMVAFLLGGVLNPTQHSPSSRQLRRSCKRDLSAEMVLSLARAGAKNWRRDSAKGAFLGSIA